MLDVTRLLCGTTSPNDPLRYGRRSAQLPSHLLRFSADKRPVVVWNITRRCNLHCLHCYASAQDRAHPEELTTQEGLQLIDDLASFEVPVLLLSGGEPLLRPDLFELAQYAVAKGLRTVLSTNGTLITPAIARRLKETGFSYVGVSLDGIGEVHDRFRVTRGAFATSVAALRHCRDAGVKAGIRFTVTSFNAHQVEAIFDLTLEESIQRLCFYHLVYSGRGSRIREIDLPLPETRSAVETIFRRTRQAHQEGHELEVLTVDNHADAPFLYQRLREEEPRRAEEVYELLVWNGGNNSGVAIGCVDELGEVHADQFWRHYSFGNVRQRPFGDIWLDTTDPLMRGLKDRKPLLKGRCGTCRYLPVCNGNFRVRAEAVYGDVWAPDPACYLSDEETQNHE